MKRPSFQFYPADWKGNAKLRRCCEAARGVWMDILCVLHDEDEYGVARYPLEELARAAGASIRFAKELVSRGVLKGADSGPVIHVKEVRHAGKVTEVTLIETTGPCWFSSRMVDDEHTRTSKGATARFTADNQPSRTPKQRQGERQGDGSTTSSSSSSAVSTEPNGSGAEAPFELNGHPAWWPKVDKYGRVVSELTDKIVFDVGKAVLGKSSGGQIKKLTQLYRDYRAVTDLLLQAETKSNPGEWIAAVIRNRERDCFDDLPALMHEKYPEAVYR